VFVMGDAVVAAPAGQDRPEGFYHLDRMVRSVGQLADWALQAERIVTFWLTAR
jgi:sulfur relay (sulfurtransferase) complex TusBCD TusD component (DsrE family)